MQVLGPATEDDVVTAFLEAELSSKRHSDRYHAALEELSLTELPEGFLTRASFAELRSKLLSLARGWPDKELFNDFPAVSWQKAKLELEDVQRLDYIRYDYWDELSHGSHRVTDGAASVKAGSTFFEVPNTSFWNVADLVRDGKVFPPLVALLDSETDRLTLLEGHTRATGFALAGAISPNQLILVGTPLEKNIWSREDKS